jgi:RNA polymerase sigma factor (TIGR02999 family)
MTSRDPEPLDRDALLAETYEQLKAIARNRMAGERREHTLQATALVHEAYLRLWARPDRPFESRTHFFRAAAEAMRRILVEHARMRSREKRGAARARLPLDVVDLAAESDPAEILALDDAFRRLRERDPRAAHVAELRFFAGLSIEEAAESLGISVRTAHREWALARAWLHRELDDGTRGAQAPRE